MARRKNGDENSVASDHRAGRDPVDLHPEWLEIYARLKKAVGEWPAFNWFGECRFDGMRDGVIILGFWSAFMAREALSRHGYHLCLASGARAVTAAYDSAWRPAARGPAPHAVSGEAHYSLPPRREQGAGIPARTARSMRPPSPARPSRNVMPAEPELPWTQPVIPHEELRRIRTGALYAGIEFPDTQVIGQAPPGAGGAGADDVTPPDDGWQPPEALSAGF